MTNRTLLSILNNFRIEIENERIKVVESKPDFITEEEKERLLSYYGGQIDLINQLIDYIEIVKTNVQKFYKSKPDFITEEDKERLISYYVGQIDLIKRLID